MPLPQARQEWRYRSQLYVLFDSAVPSSAYTLLVTQYNVETCLALVPTFTSTILGRLAFNDAGNTAPVGEASKRS